MSLIRVRGAFEQAAELYRKLVVVWPRPVYFHNLGWLYFLSGSYEQAVSAFERYLELDPGNLETLFNLARPSKRRGAATRRLLLDPGAPARGLIPETRFNFPG